MEEVFNDFGRKTTLQVNTPGVLLLDDWATATQNHIGTLGWECLHHPPYSVDLAPSDFHLVPALKKNLIGRRFGSNAEVKQTAKRCLHAFI
ncbi:histone-lysine N-methyltransferase SETMAR [Trichonephila clavipes]|nr:histone-lysine N-methyltransferase SETMAR [Trichonephila clavipes]